MECVIMIPVIKATPYASIKPDQILLCFQTAQDTTVSYCEIDWGGCAAPKWGASMPWWKASVWAAPCCTSCNLGQVQVKSILIFSHIDFCLLLQDFAYGETELHFWIHQNSTRKRVFNKKCRSSDLLWGLASAGLAGRQLSACALSHLPPSCNLLLTSLPSSSCW